MIKMCIISAAEDEILQRFLDSLENINGDYSCYILRNKPTQIEIKNPKVTMKIVKNEKYVTNGNVKFVKLRCDSVEMANPKENDIIMLGDDDMVFLEEFEFNCLPLFENGAMHISLTNFPSHMGNWDISSINGIYNGQYMRYCAEAWNKIKKYAGYFGGGEDSLISLEYYYASGGKCLRIYNPNVKHEGFNTAKYFNPKYRSNPDFLIYHLKNSRNLQEKSFDHSAEFLYNEVKKAELLPNPRPRFLVGNEEHDELLNDVFLVEELEELEEQIEQIS